MTRYIVKEYSEGERRRVIVTIPNGLHPKVVRPDSPFNQFQPGARIFYESNGQEVGLIYRAKNGIKRVRWHRL